MASTRLFSSSWSARKRVTSVCEYSMKVLCHRCSLKGVNSLPKEVLRCDQKLRNLQSQERVIKQSITSIILLKNLTTTFGLLYGTNVWILDQGNFDLPRFRPPDVRISPPAFLPFFTKCVRIGIRALPQLSGVLFALLRIAK